MNFWRAILPGFIVMLQACGGDKVPDVADIKVETTVQRFDRDFFALDTTQIDHALNRLLERYPQFLQSYLTKILGIDPFDPEATSAIKAFLRSYEPVFQQANEMAGKRLPEIQQEIEQALKYLKYYVPSWQPDSPFVITTFIGPMDVFEPFALGDYGDVRTGNGVGVALQLHLGADAAIYNAGREAGIFYDYQTRRFTPEMIPVNSLKNVIVDLFPYQSAGNTLIDEMIEKGKRFYLLDKVLPETPDSLKLGYTGEQMKGSYSNEALIWNFFVKNDLLYSKDVSINKNYIQDGPKTNELGEGAPGYIGLFVGRQVVRSYMEKHPEVSIPELMQKPPRQILEEAKYKP